MLVGDIRFMRKMATYLCLDCGHELVSRRPPERLAKPRQCGSCWGYNLILKEEYQRCKDRANELIETTPLGAIPFWDVIRGIFIERGVRLSPRLTLILCDRLYNEIMRERGLI